MKWTPALLILLAACGADTPPPEPRVVTVEVKVPVKQPCVPVELEDAPVFPDTDEALRKASDAAERYQLMGAGRPLRIARLNELEAVVKGCR
jgi:hypothetical protein